MLLSFVSCLPVFAAFSVIIKIKPAVAGGSSMLMFLRCCALLSSYDFFALLAIIILVVVDISFQTLFFGGEATSRSSRCMILTR